MKNETDDCIEIQVDLQLTAGMRFRLHPGEVLTEELV